MERIETRAELVEMAHQIIVELDTVDRLLDEAIARCKASK